jgi:hypothetical protein
MHIRQSIKFNRACNEAAIASGSAIRRQVQPGEQTEIAASLVTRHILHAKMQQVAKSVEDQLVADTLNTRRDVGMMTDHEIEARVANRLLTKLMLIGATWSDLQFLAVVNGQNAVVGISLR